MYGAPIGTHQRSFGRYHQNKSPYNSGKSSRGRSQGVPQKFSGHPYMGHIARPSLR